MARKKGGVTGAVVEARERRGRKREELAAGEWRKWDKMAAKKRARGALGMRN